MGIFFIEETSPVSILIEKDLNYCHLLLSLSLPYLEISKDFDWNT